MNRCPGEDIQDISEFTAISANIYDSAENIIMLAHKLQKDDLAYSLPFCQTIEGQAYGGRIYTSEKPAIPKFPKETYQTVDELPSPFLVPHIDTINQAITILASEKPVIANLMGPISVFTSICNNARFYRDWRKDKLTHAFTNYRKFIFRLAKSYVNSGATILSYSDPCVTKGILGNKYFAKAATINLNILDDLKKLEVPIHLCPRFIDDLNEEDTQKEVIGFTKDTYMNLISKSKGEIVSGSCIKSLAHKKDHIIYIK